MKKTFFSIAIPILILLLAGCAPGSGGSGSSDTTSPEISSTVPTDNASEVSVNTDMSVTFSEEILESTASSSNIALTETSTQKDSRVSISYDNTSRLVTVSPLKPLKYGVDYTLSISGIKDIAGNVMTSRSFSFSTFKNLPTIKTFYDTTGDIDIFTEIAYDQDGTQISKTFYDSTGDVRKYILDISDQDGMLIRKEHYESSGDNGEWFNDDKVTHYYYYSYNQDGNRIRNSHYSRPVDATSDDLDDYNIDQRFYIYYYDQNGNQTRKIEYSDASDDGEPFTDDDVLSQYFTYNYDQYGNQTREYNYKVGPDNEWFTEDDVLETYTINSYDQYGKKTRENIYDIDDVITIYMDYSYDQDGNLIKMETFSGTDNQMKKYISYSYDQDGNITLETKYIREGWFSEDYVIEYKQEYDTSW